MKPSPIHVIIIEEDECSRKALAAFLSADGLVEIAECMPFITERVCDDGIDVIILGLSGNGSNDRANLCRLKDTGVPVIAVSRADKEPEECSQLADYTVIIPAGSAALQSEELYTRLKYQIRNARLARIVKQSGFKGTWRVFPSVKSGHPAPSPDGEFRKTKVRLIAIGASAGGTLALAELIPFLPPDMPAVMLVQHMPEDFVGLFASHLRDKSRMRICLAEGGEHIVRGCIYMTALDKHLTVISRDGELFTSCEDNTDSGGICPSVNKLFSSVAAAAGPDSIGVLLTGMGSDGADGLLEMRNAGAYTICQDEQTCAVYGMPQAACKIDAVIRQLPLNQIAPTLQKLVFPGERGSDNAE